MAEHGVAALSHPPSGERVRPCPVDPSGAWDQDHPPSTETTTQESGLRENRTSRLSERTEEGRKPDLLRLYSNSGARFAPCAAGFSLKLLRLLRPMLHPWLTPAVRNACAAPRVS